MKREPALILGIVSAALALLVLYGIINNEQSRAWEALIVALFPLIQAWLTRGYVMPTGKIRDAGYSPESISAAADLRKDRS